MREAKADLETEKVEFKNKAPKNPDYYMPAFGLYGDVYCSKYSLEQWAKENDMYDILSR